METSLVSPNKDEKADSDIMEDSGQFSQPQNHVDSTIMMPGSGIKKSGTQAQTLEGQGLHLPAISQKRQTTVNNFNMDGQESEMISSKTNLIDKNRHRASKSAMSRGDKETRSEVSSRTKKNGTSRTNGGENDKEKRINDARNALITNDNKMAGIYNDESDGDGDIEMYDFNQQELEHVNKLRSDYKMGKSLIHRQRQKREGIIFGELKKAVIDDSFTLGNQITMPTKDKDENNLLQPDFNTPFLEQIIISNENMWYQAWYQLYVFSCLTSSYFYAFMAAFQNPQKDSFLFMMDNVFEVIFYISFFLNFIVDYQPPDHPKPVKDIAKISMRYLRGNFVYDFLPLIPFTYIPLNGDQKFFYIIKILRLVIGLQILKVPKIMEKIKKIYQAKLDRIIETDPVLREDTNQDNNNISLLIAITNGIKIIKLVLIIFNISYFLGFFWFIFCELNYRITKDKLSTLDPVYFNTETFYTYFGLEDNNNGRNAIVVVYYAFTSLSTVGFGDLHPRSNSERLVCSFILLFGVAIFSYIMSIFIEILDQYKNLNADLDEGDNLSKFFGLLRRFNDNVPIKIQLKEQIEKHFDYKWKKDKNQSVNDPEEEAMLDQLPEEVQNRIFCEFLFSDFQKLFMRFFRIPKNYDQAHHNSGILDPKYHDFYNMEDQEYRNFMMQLLKNLEPRSEESYTMLFEELDEITEVIFIERGECDVGYEINKKKKFVIRYSTATVIGGFNCTFNKRAIFCYRTKTRCEGYSIRKQNWKDLIDEDAYPNIAVTLKKNVEKDYLKNIKEKVLACKKKHIAKYHNRKDYQQMLTIIPHEALEEGVQMNIIGEKLNLIDKKGGVQVKQQTQVKASESQQEEEDDQRAKEEYKEMQQKAQVLISDILCEIDKKHWENIEMAQQLYQISEQLADAKLKKGENLNENSISHPLADE